MAWFVGKLPVSRMTTAQGIANHCQNTSYVSGGGNNSGVRTSYIALFRLSQRQVQFTSSSPLPVSDGDQTIVAGRLWRGELYADAVRNVTTGLTRQAGAFSRFALALFLLALGFFLWLRYWYSYTFLQWLFVLPVLGAIYLLWRVLEISRAWFYVRSAAHP